MKSVEIKSPASRAGLQAGDVVLSIDGVCLNEFRSFAEITQHVRGKNELRLVLMAENLSKRIQFQLRAEQIRRLLVEKRTQLGKVLSSLEKQLLKHMYMNLFKGECASRRVAPQIWNSILDAIAARLDVVSDEFELNGSSGRHYL